MIKVKCAILTNKAEIARREFGKSINNGCILLMIFFEEFKRILGPSYHFVDVHVFIAMKQVITLFFAEVLINTTRNCPGTMDLFSGSSFYYFLSVFTHHYSLNSQVFVFEGNTNYISF